jgi:crotonobetainyl-CoA:carnitine CoA-transferase CaiB-like acyl-CoA transferase
LVLAASHGQSFPPDGNRRPDMAPHDAFACAGDDQWVVIACPDDATWTRLAALIGTPELASPAFLSLQARRDAREKISSLISRWTQQRTKHEAADLLQGAGVPAAPVNSGGDVFRDPFLRTRGFVHEVRHPTAGVSEYPGLAYRLSKSPGAIRTPAPRFGENTFDVLEGQLGMARADIDRLVKEGVVLLEPIGAAPPSANRRTK